MKIYLVMAALLAIAFASNAQAQQSFPRDLTLSWTNASAFVDGTLMEPGDLTGVRAECFRQNDTVPLVTGNFVATGEGLAQNEVLAGAIPRPGTYTCFAYSIVIGGIESDGSSPDMVKFVGKPLPPTVFTVQ